MNIGFDLDGVLYPWHKSALTELQLFHGVKEDYEEFWGGKWKEFPEEWWKEFVKIEHLYGNMFIDTEALETLNYFDSKGHTIYYITNRPREIQFATKSWLRRSKVPQRNNLIFTKAKAEYIVDLEIEYYVEDRIDNAMSLKDLTNVIIFRQPHNREVQDQFTCINSIKELRSIIE